MVKPTDDGGDDEGRMLPQRLDDEGFMVVDLQRRNGTWETRRVHELVLESFRGPCPPGMKAVHLDGDKTNNKLDNLAYKPVGDEYYA